MIQTLGTFYMYSTSTAYFAMTEQICNRIFYNLLRMTELGMPERYVVITA